jgi:hypothetical protein
VTGEHHLALVGDFAEDGLEQRGFSRAVTADDGGDLAAVGVEAHVLHQCLPRGTHRDVFDF